MRSLEKKIVSWQNIEFLNYFLGFLTRKVITRKNFDWPLLLITEPWKSNNFSSHCSRKKTRNSCYLWTVWNSETWRQGSCPEDTCLPSTTQRGAMFTRWAVMQSLYYFVFTNQQVFSYADVLGFSFRTGRPLSCLVRLRTTLTRGKRLSSGRAFTQRRAAKPWTVTR